MGNSILEIRSGVRSRVAMAFLILSSLVVGACAKTVSDLGILSVPDVGETDASFLDDGHPVFVVHDVDGTIHVVEAVSTHIVEDQMGWCPSSRTIDDVFHGARWDAKGRYVSGPAPTNLGTYRFEVSDEGSEVTVLAYVEPSPRSESPDGMAGPDCVVGGGYQIHPFYETG